MQFDKIASVYSGKAGACCCGCKGKHSYASAHWGWASDHRGYQVRNDEINDRMVKRVANIIEMQDSFFPIDRESETHRHVEVGGRIYIAYFVH